MNARTDRLTRSSFSIQSGLAGIHRAVQKSIHKRRNISWKTAVKYSFQLRKIYRERKEGEKTERLKRKKKNS